MRNRLLPEVGAITRLARFLGVGLVAAMSLAGCQSGEKTALDEKLAQRDARVAREANKQSEVQKNPNDVDKGWSLSDINWDVRDWSWFGLVKHEEPPPPPVESLVLRGDGIEEAKAPLPGTAAARLAGAHELLREGKYALAEALFRRLADNEKNPIRLAEEARYYQAECLRLQKYYPEAADTYSALMSKFPNNPYREQAVHHMYDIANYWLDDTRQELIEQDEVRDGKRLYVWHSGVHLLDTSKPYFDEKGRAVELLEKVHLYDITGPLSDQALFRCGAVKYDDLDFAEADYYFSQIHEHHPNSPLAEKAVELAIKAKNNSTGGAEYDGRKSAEARILVQSALNNYPGLSGDPEKREELMNDLKSISMQQAEKDYKMAEFWERTGHPGSAYFYFELVRRRYPGTKFAELATGRMEKLHVAAEKEQNQSVKPVEAPFREAAPTMNTAPVATPAPASILQPPVGSAPPPFLPQDIKR